MDTIQTYKHEIIKQIFGKLALIGKITGFTTYKNLPSAITFYHAGKKCVFYQIFDVDFTRLNSCALSIEKVGNFSGNTKEEVEKIYNFLIEQKVI